jgi:hypothetical protein
MVKHFPSTGYSSHIFGCFMVIQRMTWDLGEACFVWASANSAIQMPVTAVSCPPGTLAESFLVRAEASSVLFGSGRLSRPAGAAATATRRRSPRPRAGRPAANVGRRNGDPTHGPSRHVSVGGDRQGTSARSPAQLALTSPVTAGGRHDDRVRLRSPPHRSSP